MARFWIFPRGIIAASFWQLRLAEESQTVTLALIRPEERTGRWEKPKNQVDVKADEERLEYLVKNGKGLVPHVWLSDAMQKIGKRDYVIFNQIYAGPYREQLVKNGIRLWAAPKSVMTGNRGRKKPSRCLGTWDLTCPEAKRLRREVVGNGH